MCLIFMNGEDKILKVHIILFYILYSKTLKQLTQILIYIT